MKSSRQTIMATAAALASIGMANAHIVAVGWKPLASGTVQFSVLHWHDALSSTDGFLLFDGIEHPFTSFTNDTPFLSGFKGALVNSDYATWDGAGKITATSENDDWMHVTISGIKSGQHTLGSSDIALTRWELDGELAEFQFDFTGGDDSERLLSSTLRMTSISVARTATRDVGARLYRLRSGVRSETTVTTQAPPSAKGGMSNDAMTVTKTCPWEVYGQMFYVNEDIDAQSRRGQLLQPDTSTDIFGGTVGFDYEFNENITAGFALSASRTNADMTHLGDIDIDNLTLMPYISYYRPLDGMTFYADLLYGYGMNDYDTKRLPQGDDGDTDGDFHTLEFNTGLNLQTGQYIHGPFAQLRWVDGEIDSYTEKGSGAVSFAQSDYNSLATQLGYQVSYPMAMASGTLVPQARAAWEHEFDADQGNIAGLPLGELDEDLAVLGLGIGYFTSCGWNAALDYEARLGSDTQSHYVGLKIGKEF